MPSNSSDPDFTLITAVYNTAEYLDECIESVVAQTVGIERIELILIDDASTDGSLARCQQWAARYPDSIRIIEQGQNQGVSAARNAGLAVARGRYVNFLDSDDRLMPDNCEQVEQFFAQHPEGVDVVALPIVFFDGETGAHPLNDKFEGGTRVIDLDREWCYTQNFVSSIFVRAEVLGDYRFDTQMPISEDLKYVHQLLLRTHRLGVISDTHYLYRRRSGSNLSAIQTRKERRVWYVPTLQRGLAALFDEAKRQGPTVPKYLQFLAMYELQWRLMMRDVECPDMQADERRQYYQLMHLLLTDIDDDVIMCQKYISAETKAYAKLLKRGWDIDLVMTCRRLRLLKLLKYVI